VKIDCINVKSKQLKMIAFILILLAIDRASALCNCATYVDYQKTSTYSIHRRLSGCDDNELQTECKRAEWEMVDFVNGVMNYARAIVIAHPNPDPNGEEIDGNDLGQLSLALEKHRPVPDCSTGLFTTTPASYLKDRSILEPLWDEDYDDDDDIMKDFCISKEILLECESAQKAIGGYIAKVLKHLDESEKVSTRFNAVIRTRLEDSILPTISCETTKHIKFKATTNDSNKVHLSACLLLMGILYLIH